MIDPKPVIGPAANEVGPAPVPPLDGPALPPPPQPASSTVAGASCSTRWRAEAGRRRMVARRIGLSGSAGAAGHRPPLECIVNVLSAHLQARLQIETHRA